MAYPETLDPVYVLRRHLSLVQCALCDTPTGAARLHVLGVDFSYLRAAFLTVHIVEYVCDSYPARAPCPLLAGGQWEIHTVSYTCTFQYRSYTHT